MSLNGSGLRETQLKDRRYEAEDSAASAKRKTDVEKWAALLAAGAAQAQSVPHALAYVPDGWRSDVEGMTPTNAGSKGTDALDEQIGVKHPANAAEANTEPCKLQVRVSIGDMGELALVLERSAEGVKIQISAQDAKILEMMAQEREALASALSGVGQAITSLSFVAMDETGIKFAQPRVGSQPNKTQRDGNHSAHQTDKSKRRSRGLNFIG